MSTVLDDVMQGRVLRHFRNITRIPHPSGQEQWLAEFIAGYAYAKGWQYQQDTVGNLLIRVPGTNGLAHVPWVCLQAHMDMVCIDAEEKIFGNESFPLQLQFTDGWLSATGTTLGADNGIGVAIALAAAESLAHGPLELLFTVGEEGGLTGATALELPIESKRLINLDSEDWGDVYIGCAGGGRADITIPFMLQDRMDKACSAWRISISGLQGGHSGLEIDKGRSNAIIVLARLLQALGGRWSYHIADITGGIKTSAIPKTASAVVLIEDEAESVRDYIHRLIPLHSSLFPNEAGLRITSEQTEIPARSIPEISSRALEGFLQSLPNGVISMMPNGETVQTSCNVAIIGFDPDAGKCSVTLMPRSSEPQELREVQDLIAMRCANAAKDPIVKFKPSVTFGVGYPGWKPDYNSGLLQTFRATWSRVFPDQPLRVKVIHAGLECGILGSKYPGMQMVSFGPQINGAHTASERVSVSSVQDSYEYLGQLLLALVE